MNEILNFMKDIITGSDNEKTPIGLCGFDCEQETKAIEAKKPKKKSEMRLSELME